MKSNRFFLVCAVILGVAFLAVCAPAAKSSAITADNLDELPYEMSPEQVFYATKTGEVVVLDVREIWEYEEGHLPDAVLIPVLEVENRLAEIPTDKHVIVTCRSGNRSGQIAEFLTGRGYTKVHNMQGGILAWNTLNLPIEKE